MEPPLSLPINSDSEIQCRLKFSPQYIFHLTLKFFLETDEAQLNDRF